MLVYMLLSNIMLDYFQVRGRSIHSLQGYADQSRHTFDPIDV